MALVHAHVALTMLLAAIFACSAAILVEGLKASRKRRYSDLEQPAVPAVALELECDGSELMSDSGGGSSGTGSGTSGERLSLSAVPVLHTLVGTM